MNLEYLSFKRRYKKVGIYSDGFKIVDLKEPYTLCKVPFFNSIINFSIRGEFNKWIEI